MRGTLTILGSQGFGCTAAKNGGNNNGGSDASGDDNENDDGEVTVIGETTVLKETIPGKNLPNTVGEAGGDATMAGPFAGAGVFVLLGALVVRIHRFRNS